MTTFHLADGPEQQARDARFGSLAAVGEDPYGWIYAYDALTVDLTPPPG